jgi:2-keto-4-pentenoate hydratase/2-oxohepta-3-ene-1,7-dioic acid hydratase in catechol pathway
MKLALFDDNRLGVVTGAAITDVTAALPWPHDPDPLTAGWWRAVCRDFAAVRPEVEKAVADLPSRPLDDVRLRAPALNPSKIVACASNYAAHVEEMHAVQERTLGQVESWMMNFDVFLKAPSSLTGPGDPIVLPEPEIAAGHEIHHEAELVIVIGTGGRDIPEDRALDHVLGYTAGLDVTVRSAADRSRRKSHDTFSPLGPWITTADELPDPASLTIELVLNETDRRQHVTTKDLITPVPAIVSYASRMMTLVPGDLIFTGAPPGVGPIHRGDRLDMTISGIGRMHTPVT